MKNIQHLAASALIERSHLKIGLATFRKTGYCLAIFSEANHDDLKKSARHSQYSKDSATYAKDTEGFYKQHLANRVPMNCVKKWSKIRVEAFGQSEVMSALQGSWTVEIGKLTEYCVWEVLIIPKGHQYETNMLMLLHLAKAEATKNSSDSVEVSSLTEEYHLPQEIEIKINKIIAKKVDERIQAMLENGSLTSARGGPGMTEVAVGMGLAPSGGGGQGQGLMDPANSRARTCTKEIKN